MRKHNKRLNKNFSENRMIGNIGPRMIRDLVNLPNNFFDTTGENALWRAVITQAFVDAFSSSKKVEDRLEKARSISWLAGQSQDFMEVCHYAAVDKGLVIKKAKEALSKVRKKPAKLININKVKEVKSAEIIYFNPAKRAKKV